MKTCVFIKTYGAPPIDKAAILRYAGCRTADDKIGVLLDDCLKEAEGRFAYRVCFSEMPISISEEVCDFGVFSVPSKDLAAHLSGCDSAVLFAATVGIEVDRLIQRYTRIAPARAFLFQAIGTERVEALCDLFCTYTATAHHAILKPRFSPGYGDLPLTVQKDFFAVLHPEKNIGITLTESLLMSPTKSVTAIIGIPHRK